jgi:hypothetical protein
MVIQFVGSCSGSNCNLSWLTKLTLILISLFYEDKIKLHYLHFINFTLYFICYYLPYHLTILRILKKGGAYQRHLTCTESVRDRFHC